MKVYRSNNPEGLDCKSFSSSMKQYTKMLLQRSVLLIRSLLRRSCKRQLLFQSGGDDTLEGPCDHAGDGNWSPVGGVSRVTCLLEKWSDPGRLPLGRHKSICQTDREGGSKLVENSLGRIVKITKFNLWGLNSGHYGLYISVLPFTQNGYSRHN